MNTTGDAFRLAAAGVGSLFFIPRAVFGLLVLALLWLHPVGALFGGAAVLTALLLRLALGFAPARRLTPPAVFNPLLVGLLVAETSGWALVSGGWLLLAAGLLLVVEQTCQTWLSEGHALPVLSLPFTLTAWLLLACGLPAWRATPTPETPVAIGEIIPEGLQGFFSALAAISFSTEPAIGLTLFVALWIASRHLALLAVLGYAAATLTGLLLPGGSALAFNGILVALGLGAGLVVPSWKTFLLGTAGACLTVPLGQALLLWGVPPLTLPFCILTMGGLLLMRAGDLGAGISFDTKLPETRLADAVLQRHREAGARPRRLALPFSGQWLVWQGIGGCWTHQGQYRFAFDFIVVGEDGRECRGRGRLLREYHSFGAAVLAPCDGRVIKVTNHLPDNPVGQPDRDFNWGNLVILQHPEGWFVELSHFAQESIAVGEGQWVRQGDLLGRCGNSGFSGRPHLHIQAQETPWVGAPTVPFVFTDVVKHRHVRAFHTPAEGERLQPIPFSPPADLTMDVWSRRKQTLSPVLTPWRDILTLVRPDVLVCHNRQRCACPPRLQQSHDVAPVSAEGAAAPLCSIHNLRLASHLAESCNASASLFLQNPPPAEL